MIAYDITDHYPVMINIAQKNSNNSEAQAVLNKIIKTDFAKLQEIIKETSWANVLNVNDPELATEKFITELQEMLEKSSTLIIARQKRYKKIKPWISNGIIISIKHRDKLKKKLLKNFTTTKEAEYRAYRNNLKKIINNAKNNYYQNNITENANDIKKMYQLISEATNESKKKM